MTIDPSTTLRERKETSTRMTLIGRMNTDKLRITNYDCLRIRCQLFPIPESQVLSPHSRVPSPDSRVPSPEFRVPSPVFNQSNSLIKYSPY